MGYQPIEARPSGVDELARLINPQKLPDGSLAGTRISRRDQSAAKSEKKQETPHHERRVCRPPQF
jgi:hypothetical protein